MEQAGQVQSHVHITVCFLSQLQDLQIAGLKLNPKCFKRLHDGEQRGIFISWRKLGNFHMQAQTWPDDCYQSGGEKQHTNMVTKFTFQTNRLMKPPEIRLQQERNHVKVKTSV